MSKRVLSLTLTLIMVFGIFTTSALAADDKPSSWAEKEVTDAIAAKLVPQSLQSKYTQATTRAEFSALVVTLYEKIKGKAITERKTFSDTKDVNVEKAGSIGVATALGDNKFYPGAKITREHVAIMTARLANALGKPLPKKAAMYEDKSSISSSALESVGQVQAAGLMVEAGNKKFAAKEPYTREQSIVTLWRTFNTVNGVTQGMSSDTIDPPNGEAAKLVGAWGYYGNGVFTPISDNAEWIEFRSDGTFIYFDKTASASWSGGITGGYMQSGARSLTIKGNYTVQSGAIKCTKLLATLESLFSDEVFPDEYTDKPISDASWRYKFSMGGSTNSGPYDALEFLEIDLFSSGTYIGFTKPIDLGTIEGVINYPSALPDKVSPTEINCVFTSASGENDQWRHRFEATFNCSSESDMQAKAGAYFTRLISMGFTDSGLGLYVEGKIDGKNLIIRCTYIGSMQYAIVYFDILHD